MTDGALAKITAKTAAEICGRFSLPAEAKPFLRDGMTPKQFLDALLEKKLYRSAISFLAQALPKREAIWWGFQCARDASGANPEPVLAAALQATEKWIGNPCEDLRRPAATAAAATDLSTPASCIVTAVSYTGGSVGPPNVPRIPAGDHAPGLAVAGAVMLAVVADPAKVDEMYVKVVNLGLEVANGTNRWK